MLGHGESFLAIARRPTLADYRAMDPGLVIVVGLVREARIAAGRGRVVLGGAGIADITAARGLISFGICGALDPELGVGHVVVADGVVDGDGTMAADPAWTAALRAAIGSSRGGLVAGGDMIIGSVAAKAALRRASGASTVDMETRAVAKAARTAGLPFAVVRAVSDTAAFALPRAAQAGFKADGEPDVGAVMRTLAARPWELPALIRTALDAEKAFRSLSRAAQVLTPPPPH
jgi:hopanoid-associated phosphorylase